MPFGTFVHTYHINKCVQGNLDKACTFLLCPRAVCVRSTPRARPVGDDARSVRARRAMGYSKYRTKVKIEK